MPLELTTEVNWVLGTRWKEKVHLNLHHSKERGFRKLLLVKALQLCWVRMFLRQSFLRKRSAVVRPKKNVLIRILDTCLEVKVLMKRMTIVKDKSTSTKRWSICLSWISFARKSKSSKN